MVQDESGDGEDNQHGQDHHGTRDPHDVRRLCGGKSRLGRPPCPRDADGCGNLSTGDGAGPGAASAPGSHRCTSPTGTRAEGFADTGGSAARPPFSCHVPSVKAKPPVSLPWSGPALGGASARTAPTRDQGCSSPRLTVPGGRSQASSPGMKEPVLHPRGKRPRQSGRPLGPVSGPRGPLQAGSRTHASPSGRRRAPSAPRGSVPCRCSSRRRCPGSSSGW